MNKPKYVSANILLALILLFAGFQQSTFAQDKISAHQTAAITATESPVSIANKSYVVPGILTVPSTATKEHPAPAVLLLHGTGGNKNELGDIYKRLAAKLAANGYASLRIDFVGGGDSKVPYVYNNFDDSVLDANQAIAFLANNPLVDKARIGVLGWSQGGRIAQVVAARNESVKALVTWASASSNGATDFEDMFKYEEQAIKNGYYDFVLPWGSKLRLGKQWFVAMKNSKAMEEIKQYKGPLLAIHGSLDVIVAPAKSRELLKNAGSNDATLRILDKADHGFLLVKGDSLNPDQSTPEELLKITVDWLAEKL